MSEIDTTAIENAIWWLIGFAIAIIVGVLIGKDANSRGMNGTGWGFFTWAIMIFAIPIYLIVRKPRQDTEDRSAHS